MSGKNKAISPESPDHAATPKRVVRRLFAGLTSIVLLCPVGAREIRAGRGQEPGHRTSFSSAQKPPTAPADAAQEMSAHHHHGEPAAEANTPEEQPINKLAIPDVALVDESGRRVAFYSDLVKGNVVAINVVYTTCTTICSPMAATFVSVQKILKERGLGAIKLISITIDPATDTPDRLKAWSEQFHPGPGWSLVTGDSAEAIRLLKALQVYTADKESHSPIVLIGNDSTGKWIRANGLAPAAKLAQVIQDVQESAGVDSVH